MTKEEFDTLKVGDIITNKHRYPEFSCDVGHDYMVINKFGDCADIEIVDFEFDFKYRIYKFDMEKYLNLRKI